MVQYKINKLYFTYFFLLLFHVVAAQWFPFGRNKVQYYDFQWQILETDHFRIYYYREMEVLAGIGARFAEESYRELEKKFQFSVQEKIPLVFYANHQHFQQTNITPGFIPEGVGGFFEFMKGRVVLPFNGNMADFKHVIQHELVHVFTYYKLLQTYKAHGRRPGLMPPLWFTEGLAEYWSSTWDGMAEMIMRDAVYYNYIVPLERMYSVYGTFFMYKLGESICQYIAENYGELALLRLLENMWKYEDFEPVLKEVTGLNYEEFSTRWIYSLKKRYYPLIVQKDLASAVHPVVVKNGFNMKPRILRRRRSDSLVVYYTNRTGYAQLVWSPVRTLSFDQNEEVHVIITGEKSADFEAFHLFESGVDVHPSGLISFPVKSGESDVLYLYELDSGKIVQRKRFDGITSIQFASFTPTGDSLVFAGNTFSGQSDLFLWDRKRDTLVRLTSDFFLERDPIVSPDGKWVAFGSNRDLPENLNRTGLFLLNLSDKTVIALPSLSMSVQNPRWQADGKALYFIGELELEKNIYKMEWNPSTQGPVKLYRLTNLISSIWDFDLFPSGALLYSVYENQKFQFHLIEPGQIQLEEMVVDSLLFTGPKVRKEYYENISRKTISQSTRKEYRTGYQLDFAQSQVSQDPFWGTQGGAVLSFSDMLSNQYVQMMLYNNATSQEDFFRSLNFSLAYFNLEKRVNYGLGLYRLAGRFYNFKDQFFFEDRVGLFLAFSYPFSHFDRLEISVSSDYSDREVLAGRRRYAWLYTQYVSYVRDNTLFFVTGPIDGTRFNLTLGQTWDWRFSNVRYMTYLMDYRHYFRLTTRSAVAVRLMYLGNSGKETRWYYLGGSWDLRGYRLWSLRGDNIALVSGELRFPFLDLVVLQYPFLSMAFPQIRSALFVDMGDAWSGRPKFSSWKGAVGIGWRLNLFGALVLRFDIGKKFTPSAGKMEKKVFTQFFFGWDF